MSQLENTQSVVLEQADGKKIYLDLNISTDTTAIESFKQASLVSEKAFEKSTDISNSSFDYATGIAVFLALCATGLAYWFGARSFALTKQSFNLTLEQIGKSVEQTLNSNKELYRSQEKLKEVELNHLRKSNFERNFHEKISNYLTTFSSFRQKVILDTLHINKEQWKDFETNPPTDSEISHKFYNCYESMLMLTTEISFLLNYDKAICKDLMKTMGELNSSLLSSLLLLVEGKNRINQGISDLTIISKKVHNIAIDVSKSLDNLKG